MTLSRLWVAMLTRNVENAGTDSAVTFTITLSGVDRFSVTLSDPDQVDQARGEANIYELDISGLGISARDMGDSSIRVGIRGDDAWLPEHIFVWGEDRVISLLRTEIVPVAMETDITVQLSTDEHEGPASMPMRLVRKGGVFMPVRRLLMLTVTAGTAESGPFTQPNPVFGTTDPIEVQIVSRTGIVTTFEIVNTSQTDLRSGYANFYNGSVVTPFSKAELGDDAVVLRLNGLDNWEPVRFFLFGLNNTAGRPRQVVPLVHIPAWPYGFLEATATSGVASVNLPLVSEPPLNTPGGEVEI